MKTNNSLSCNSAHLVRQMKQRRVRCYAIFSAIFVVLIGELLFPYWKNWNLPIDREDAEIRLLLASDPHLQIYETLWNFLAVGSAYDNDCYLQRYFDEIVKRFNPDGIIIAGDLLDGGSMASSAAFINAVERIKNIFLSRNNIPCFLVPGDNDIGGAWDDPWSKEKSELFHHLFRSFTKPKRVGLVSLYGRMPWVEPDLWEFMSSETADNLVIYVTHNPAITPYGAEFSQVLLKIKPALLISGHDHVAYALHWEKRSNISERIFWLMPPNALIQPTKPFQFDLRSVSLKSSGQDTVVQLGVPSCTYRSGQPHLAAYGTLEIWRNRTIRYNLLPLPNRQNILIFYVLAFGCVILLSSFSRSLQLLCSQLFFYTISFMCTYFLTTRLY